MNRIAAVESANQSLGRLYQRIIEKEQRPLVSFHEFLDILNENPGRVFRNIFQLFYDMIQSRVGDGIDEYPDDPESINYVYYDCNDLFVAGTDHPFFADRLFANRLINHISTFRRGSQQNRIFIFEGPHGCGKSTFLNNLLLKFEQYTNTREGTSFETVWRLNKENLGNGLGYHDANTILTQLKSLVENSSQGVRDKTREKLLGLPGKDYIEVPCPSHDHPLLLIPKPYRKEFIEDVIQDRDFKQKLYTEKQYEWVFRDTPCTICLSLYQTLIDMLDSPLKIFDMIYTRRYQFNRRLGEGISVFNPGDKVSKNNVINNQLLQSQLDGLLKDSNRVKYIYSRYAKTNNGIYSLMDIKGHNKERFANLHGIISEGVHKVEDMEENVNSLFLALMNPEDKDNIGGTQSFSDRITYIKIPYILDYNTEVKIYKNIFGDNIEEHFLPRILQNFAKVIISSRLKPRSEALLEWIGEPNKYGLYCDLNLQLLKMDIYSGVIPPWLKEEDRKKFTAKRRRRIIAESEYEGNRGFSGRDSIEIFNEFYSTYSKMGKLINMDMVCNFFRKYQRDYHGKTPEGFLDSLVRLYDYTVLQEVKESLYYYNEERISKDIQNYLFSINFEVGRTVKCVYTGEDVELNEEFFENMERLLLGPNPDQERRMNFRRDIQNQYTSKTLTQEIMVEGKRINETDIYRSLHDRYVHNLKDKVMDPFLKNDNFRSAIKDYGTDSFRAYDKRIRDEIVFLIKNLNSKYAYSEQGAKEVCIYVVDNDLAGKFTPKSAD